MAEGFNFVTVALGHHDVAEGMFHLLKKDSNLITAKAEAQNV